MKILFIYGAPGIGKLTIAEEVSKKTGMKIFHNHLTFDFASSFFEQFSPGFNNFREGLLLNSLKLLTNEQFEGLILTYCYTKEDFQFVSQIQEVCKEKNIEISYVLLTCNKEENLKRVVNDDRKKFKKLTDANIWESLNDNYNLTELIPNTQTKIIDNTSLKPNIVAQMIIDFL